MGILIYNYLTMKLQYIISLGENKNTPKDLWLDCQKVGHLMCNKQYDEAREKAKAIGLLYKDKIEAILQVKLV